ncbi:hypothetical protein [Streptomyces griseoflavus]|uniref:hypothetical protein n=1 Tax=Streptomyces griseoflavus TaxID=35619 RepID=UPI0003037275|nr:hypothetical protein [Streptomyces griseoflavus]
MFKSKKIAAVAGVLGGFVLIGAGAAQAVGAEGPGDCVKDTKGTVRCAQVSEYEVTSDEYGKMRVATTRGRPAPAGPRCPARAASPSRTGSPDVPYRGTT